MSEQQPEPLSTKDAKRQAKADVAADKARAKAERPIWKKKRFIIPVALLVLVVVAVATSGGDDATLVEPDDPEQAERAEEAEQAQEAVEDAPDEGSDEVAEGFGIGETIAMGDLEHTLHGVRFYEGDEFMSPDEGTRWLIIDAELTNNSDESEPVSSVIMWRLVDQDNRTTDMTFSGDENGSLDGELGAGRSMRGEITYLVDEDQTEWELIFEPNLFGFGQGIYSFTADEAS